MKDLFKLFDFGGDPGAPETFFDKDEFNRSKRLRDKYLGDFKTDRTRYRGLRDTYSGREQTMMDESGRLYGLGEKAIDSSGRFITNAARLSGQAGQMATGRGYKDTQDAIRRKGYDLDRLQGEMEGIRGAMGRRLNIGNSKYSAVLRDAMTSFYSSEKANLDTRLANSNLAPAAQMALKERLARGAAESVTKAEIQGLISQEDADMRGFLNEAKLLGSEFDMTRAGIDTLITQQDLRRAQQQDILSAASGDLNVAASQMNQGTQFMNLGQAAFNRGRYAGDTSRFYEGAQQGMTSELLGDARERMTQQQQLQMQDAANQQAYNEYQAQSGQRGFNNLMNAASTAARVYMAVQTAGMSEGANLAVNAAAGAMAPKGRADSKGYQDTILRQQGIGNYSGSNTGTGYVGSGQNPGTGYIGSGVNYNNQRIDMTGRSNFSGGPMYQMQHGSPWFRPYQSTSYYKNRTNKPF